MKKNLEQKLIYNPEYDSELIALAQQGSADAKWELFAAFKPMIKAIAKKKTLAFPQEEEDLYAYLCLEFMLCLEKYDADKTAEFHIYIATCLSYAGYHNYQVQKELQQHEQLIMDDVPETPAEDENFEALHRKMIIEDIMKLLTPEEQALVLARYRYGLTFRQMGERFGISHIGVRKKITKIIAKIQEEFEDWELD